MYVVEHLTLETDMVQQLDHFSFIQVVLKISKKKKKLLQTGVLSNHLAEETTKVCDLRTELNLHMVLYPWVLHRESYPQRVCLWHCKYIELAHLH